jgi:hypothetical protein
LGVRKNQGRWKINIKDNKLLPPKEVCDVLEAPREGRPANCLVREDNPHTGITKKKPDSFKVNWHDLLPQRD